ncbi:Acid phosphatase (macronuclear) [Paramecium tetraurelia strain d4-2]|nr:Acid phosphatase [Paramecium tetraurelia strain d4-2]CAH03575.1 Acid phosphatase, putative [Paramecium tetraurelia]
MFGDQSCQFQLSHLQYDTFISTSENQHVTFLKSNPFKRNFKIEFQIHNSSVLQFQHYQNDELIQNEFVNKSFLVSTNLGDNCIPYGQRISLGYYYTNYNKEDDIIDITYNTQSYCPQGFLHIFDDNGIDSWIKIRETRILNMSKIYENSSQQFTYVTYINIVSLNSQTIQRLGQIYYYEIYGDIQTKSSKYQFKVPLKQYDNKEHKIIFFGDMDSNWTGNKSKQTFDWFQSIQYNQSVYDALIFEGDMAYDLESQDCQQGDWWLRNMTTFTSYYPLLSTPGNHDSGANYEFDFYRMSFLSPDKSQYNTRKNYYNFYSVDLGLVHYIFYNPTNIVYDDSNQQQIDEMVQIMENDLNQANQNREKVPWIIVNSHFPMYCSDSSDNQCSQNFIALRPFADLFTKYRVAIYMSAHQHNYERDAPFINNQSQVNTGLITDGPEQHLVKNSAAPIYVVEGSAGQEYYTPLVPYESQPYTVYQTGYNDGIGIMTIHNSTHIYFEQLDLVTQEVVDYFWCVQDRQDSSSKALNVILWTFIGFFILGVLGMGIFYLIRRQKIKEQLLP